MKQIDENDYNWLSYDLIETCMERYKSVIYDEVCEGSLFEAEKYIYAGSYILASIIFSILAIFAGIFLTKVIIT